jgi:predicted ester cyclase
VSDSLQPGKQEEQPMSHEAYLATFRRVIDEAYNRGEVQVLHEVFDPEFIENQFGLSPTIEGMAGDIAYLRRSFPDFHLTIEEEVAQDDRLWVRMTARGTNLGGFMGPPNGKSFEVSVFDEIRFENGRIAEHWGAPDRFALLSQLGLLPRPAVV